MASIRRLFEAHLDSPSGISNASTWEALEKAVDDYGLGSDVLHRTLSGVWATSSGKPVQYADILRAAMQFAPDNETDQTIADLKQDAAALRRFVDYVHANYRRKDKPERRQLDANLEDVADSYRATLLHALRLAAKEADAIDALTRSTLLLGPILAALKEEAGPAASLDSAVWMPNPWDWQRVHSHALNVRLARVYCRAKNLQRVQRLYRIDREVGTGAQATGTATGAGQDRLAAGMGPMDKTVAGLFKPPKRDMPPPSAARLAATDVYLAQRLGSNAEDCAQSAIPFELEVIRLPVLGSLDAVAAASVTLAGYYSAHASVPRLITPAIASIVPSSSASGQADLMNSSFAMEEGKFASHMAQGGMPIPAPTALPHVPRAHAATLNQAYAEYQAGSELILSPYMADVCGVHEADEGKVAAVVGGAVLFCTEHIPGQVPLSQLLETCGRMPEDRPWFRYLATELCRALCDIESQCSLGLTPGSITCENVYVSEGGTRVTLRGIAWGSPIPANTDATPELLEHRSAALLACLGEILRECLVESVAAGAMAVRKKEHGPGLAEAELPGPDNTSLAEARKEVERAGNSARQAASRAGQDKDDGVDDDEDEDDGAIGTGPDGAIRVHQIGASTLGLTLTDQETCRVVLADPPGHDGAWVGPVLQMPGYGHGVPDDADEAGLSTLAMVLTGGRTADGKRREGGAPVHCVGQPVRAQGSTTFTLTGHAVGSCTLHFYYVRPGYRQIGAGPVSGTAPVDGPTGDGPAARVASLMASRGFLAACPPAHARLSAVEVPVAVYRHNTSPVMTTILAACDPEPQESAPMATLKLLSAVYGRATGMVNGRKGRPGLAGEDGQDGRGPDPITDDATFLAVSRMVAALLGLTQTGGGMLGNGAAGGDAATPAGGALVARGTVPVPPSGKAASSLAYGDVSDTDALAALVAALDPRAEGHGGEAMGPQGSAAADVDAMEQYGSGAGVKWVCHLARHPWFNVAPTDSATITGDFHSYAMPLAQLRAAVHGEKAVPARA